MKKLSIFAVALAAVAFAACTGNKPQNEQNGTDSVKSFEQEQIEENIKVQIDSLAAEFGKAVSKETKVDILVTPLVTIAVGIFFSWLIYIYNTCRLNQISFNFKVRYCHI